MTPADSGEYVCHVSNGAGSQETSLIVTIQGSSSSHGECTGWGFQASGCQGGRHVPGPSLLSDLGYVACFSLSPVSSVSLPIRIESSSPTVVEGQTLDLNCIVAGQPQATITWYKRGGSLPTRHQVQSGSVAVRGKALPPGAGCAGTAPQAKTLKHELAGLGGSSRQPVTPQPLASPPPPCPHAPQAHGSRLRLHQMSMADSGEYVCRANNNIDAQEASIMVSVSPHADSPSGESDEGPGWDWETQVAVLSGEKELCSQSPWTGVAAQCKGSAEGCLGSNPACTTKGLE